MNIANKNHLFNLLLLTIFFNIWFPKAGIKFSGIPFTVGNILFAFTFILWSIKKIKEKSISINKIGLLILIGILYYCIKYIFILSKYGSLKEYITYIIPLIVYPTIFFVAYDLIDDHNKILSIIKIIYYGFIFLCFYSLIQFLFGIEKVTIPGLTVNLTDYQTMGTQWFLKKSNGTDLVNSKIVSTFQNGNLFGINLLLIYPLIFNYLKSKNDNKKIIITLLFFIVCVFLTLSRTCWFGLILFLAKVIFMDNSKTKKSFLRKILFVFLIIITTNVIFKYMPSVANRLFNTKATDWISMSGRTEGMIKIFEQMKNSNNAFSILLGPVGIIEFINSSYEILPVSLFTQVGIVGIILFYWIFIIFLSYKNKNIYYQGIKTSVFIWIIIACIECGYWLPPTALNLFVLLSIGLKSIHLEKEKKL